MNEESLHCKKDLACTCEKFSTESYQFY